LQLKSTKNGKNVTGINQIGYDLGIFRMNTPEGIVWFTSGLTSGYIAGVVYAPCLDLYFAYATNKAPLKGLNKFMMMNILHSINNNKDYQKLLNKSGRVPSYCSQVKPAKEFIFPLQ
jgi:D-alanyl-D-alanine carboxypeptidase